jgi:pimeloyl-ACP methyl ester carboxylesterase
VTSFALLHGGGQGSWVWDETAKVLRAAGTQVLALDVPGCGVKRGRNVDAVDVDAIATELLADIAAAGLDKPVLVGHSLAGTILPRMVKQFPDRISKLIYLSCSAPLPGKTLLDQMGLGLHGANNDQVGWPVDIMTHSLNDRYRVMFCNDMDDAEADAFLACLGDDNWPADVFERSDWHYDHLRAFSSTYISCELDQSLPTEWQRRFAERLHCERILSVHAGHQAMNTQAEQLAEILLADASRSQS